MTASPDEPAPAPDEAPVGPSPAGTVLPRRTRRTSAIADAAAATSRTPTDWAGGDAPTLRARQAAALPERPEEATEPESAYADGFAAGLVFASRSTSGSDEEPSPSPATAAAPAPRAPAAKGRGWSRPLLLVGVGLAVGMLVCVPFLVRGSGEEDRGPAAVTLADASPADEAPGTGLATARPSGSGSPSPGGTARRSPESGSPEKPAGTASASGGKATSGATSGASAQAPAAGPSHSAAAPGTAIRSHDSGRCIDGSPPWGEPLQLWDCTGSAAQSWQIGPDGSIRSRGQCMDVANGSRDDGAAVQLVDCNGTGAQQFRLNAAHDLVNVQADKCVEAEDSPGVNGTRLRLWSCSGQDNQKWSRG
ncbi:ricin-type beta-trefoil lectin domain protein [Actinacidiphila sp. bgisy160]|uniref:ricin-type beta-trefoil lectin domain protein n=1 Tax=Actinacidiphila sp. bgisy160 TaxID=3413796 RepID=UPI003D723B74